jgi:hypothetical protein
MRQAAVRLNGSPEQVEAQRMMGVSLAHNGLRRRATALAPCADPSHVSAS